jgi:hypothetical protein
MLHLQSRMAETLTATEEEKLTARDIAELVDRGWKLADTVSKGEKAKEELDIIKAKLRYLADGKDKTFEGDEHTATVEQKNEGVSRTVPPKMLPRVLKLCGERWTKLFSLHPTKGDEKSFELNCHKILTKRSAIALINELTVTATPWVRFS